MSAQPTHGDIERAMGRLEGIVGQVLEARSKRDEHVDARLDRIETDIREIRDLLANAKGGWKVLLIIGGIAGMAAGWIVPAAVKQFMGW